MPGAGLLGHEALAGQAAGVVRGLDVRMDQRGARGRQVVGVDRTPHGRGIQPPHQLGVPDHDGQGVPDQGRRQLLQVEEVAAGIVDADRAMRRVRHDVGHHDGPALPDAALGRELGGKRDRGPLQVLAVEGTEGGLGSQFGQVRPGWRLELHPGEDPGAGSGQRVPPPAQPHPGPGTAGGQVRHAGLKVSLVELNRSHARSLSRSWPRLIAKGRSGTTFGYRRELHGRLASVWRPGGGVHARWHHRDGQGAGRVRGGPGADRTAAPRRGARPGRPRRGGRGTRLPAGARGVPDHRRRLRPGRGHQERAGAGGPAARW